jgi:glutamine amidotransferase
MCMLCVVPPHVIPSREKLENSALNNPHGFGYAIALPKERRIITHRTMNPDECINMFLEERGKYSDGYAIWHARFATHGSNTVDNCHPFMVGNDPDTYLAHNGVLPIIEDRSDRSDTRIFAEDLLPDIGGVTALDNPQVWNMLEDFTVGSKVAVLTVNPDARHPLYLLHQDKGMEDSSGVWWSNNTCYLESWYSRPSNVVGRASSMIDSTAFYDDESEWLECTVCDNWADYWTELKNGTADYCRGCGSCYMCQSTKSVCMCYQGHGYDGGSTQYDYRTGTQYGGWWNQ